MAEHAGKISKRDDGKQHLKKQRQPEPVSDRVKAPEHPVFSVGGMPFQPSLHQHAAQLSKAGSHQERADLVLHLQRTYGNTYVQRLLEQVKIQAKLTVSTPNDVYEQQADRVSEIVTRDLTAQRQEEEEEPIQAKAILQRQAETEEDEIQTAPATGMDSSPGLSPPELTSESTETNSSGMLNETPFLKVADKDLQVAPALESEIHSARINGNPMKEDVRGPMEQAFGTDFSGVRLHTDTKAHELSQSLQARAFTTGKDIFFKSGEYNPGTSSGQKLLAHELTHTIQQTGKIARIFRWGNPPKMKPAGTTHVKVTEDAFKSLDKKYEFWYSPEAQKHLAERAEDIDLRGGFLFSSWGVGQLIGTGYHAWRNVQKGYSYLERGVRSIGRGVRRAIGWAGENLGITKEQQAKEKAETPIERGSVKKAMARDFRRFIGITGEKLGITKEQREKQSTTDAENQKKLLAERARQDYDNISWYWRSPGEAPNHGESGMYKSTGGAAQSEKRVDDYLENAKSAFESGNTTQALQMVGFALHATQDRGAHGDGAPGLGHDPRRILEPPEGAKTGVLYDKKLNPDGKDCDRAEKNPEGYRFAVKLSRDLLAKFLEKIGVFKNGNKVNDREALIKGGRLGGYKQPGGLKTFLRRVAAFFGKDAIGIGAKKSSPED